MLLEAPSSYVRTDLPTEDILQGAVASVARCAGVTPQSALERLERGDRAVHSSFRYWLAKHMSAYLAGLDVAFRAIYVYGSAIGAEANPSSDIDVIVVVDRSSDEVKRLVRRIDLALCTNYRRLLGLGTLPASLLDVRIVDRTKQAERIAGDDKLCEGLHTRPICLWRSEPGSKGGSLSSGSPRQSSGFSYRAASPR
jgi:predicted nucleotidyltransferase